MVANKYFTIDAHCHIYPEKISKAAVSATERFYEMEAAHLGTYEDVLANGVPAGVDKFIVQSLATTPHQVKRINEFISESVANSGGRLIGLGTMHPNSEDIGADLEHLLELGLHGVKLHADIQNFCVDDERCLAIYELCERRGVPILMHTGDNRYDRSNPNRLYPVLKKFPRLTVVGAHFGGWSIWNEACAAYRGLENFFVDTSSSFYSLTKDEARTLIREYGADRVMFGTDYPLWRADKEIEFLLSLGLSEDEYSKIFSKSAIRAYKLTELT